MEKEKMLEHLNKGIDQQVPDVWDQINRRIHTIQRTESGKVVVLQGKDRIKTNRMISNKVLALAAACLMIASMFTFTPALAAIQQMYDKLFSSDHIDDIAVRTAVLNGEGQFTNQTFYDELNDITVQFQSIMTDDKETKLLLTYQSKSTDLENYSIDIFEGKSSIFIVGADGNRIKLNNVGWGSRYFDKKENKVAQALSFASIKEYAGQQVRLEIVDLTKWDDTPANNVNDTAVVETVWPLAFKLDQSAITDREIVVLNKEFTFENETYFIKQVEYSKLETRIVVTGSDTKRLKHEDGSEYRIMSKLENQYMNARIHDKEFGYRVDYNKTGVFLAFAGEYADPIYSKAEVEGGKDEYIMTFAPVKDRKKCVLEIGEELKIPLSQ